MDPSDLLDLYGGSDQLARARADAMSRRAQGLQGAGMILRTLAGERDPIGGALTQMGQQDENRMASAIADRPHYQTAALGAQRAQEEADAWKDPASAKLLRGAVKTFMPSLGVDEATPVPVLRNMLPIAEKFGQAGLANQWRAGLQNKIQRKRDFDSNTGQYRITYFRPLDGATWDANFRPLSPGIPNMGLSPTPTGQEQIEDVDGGAPAPAPRGPPGSSAAPGGAGPALTQPTKRPLLSRTPVAPGGTPDASAGTGGAPAPALTAGSARFPAMMGKPLGQALEKFGNDLDPNRGTGEIQKNQARLNAAIRLRKLVTDENGDVKTMIPPQFMRETAMALAQLVSAGGQPAQALVEELTPRTGSSKLADMIQWITNNPQDAGQQGFVKLYLESANREATAAQEALNRAIQGRVGKHQRLIKGNPDEARTVAQSFGWNLDPEKMTLTPIQAPEVASGEAKTKPPGGAGDRPPVPGAVKTKSGKWATKNASGQWEYVGG